MNIKKFLVGGAVRDKILNLPVKDKDWVVVGSTPEEMLSLGFKQVGADFPVFIDEKTKEEHALARTEKSTGSGYHKFSVEWKNVTLEEDLRRRDLTINAIAIDENNNFIDPFGGVKDIKEKVFRHVSSSFAEDPVRVLRIARFCARWGKNWTVAPETLDLMKSMVESGELDSLVPERIWKELIRGLHEPYPSYMLNILHKVGALKKILPEVDALYGVPQVAQYHPEVDTGVHMEMVLDCASRFANGNDSVVYAALMHDLGKGITPKEEWPKHHGHEDSGVELVVNVNKRLKVPRDCMKVAVLTCKYHLHCHRALESRPGTLLSLLENLDAFRNKKNLYSFVAACRADKCGRGGVDNYDYPQGDYLIEVFNAAKAVSAQPFVEQGLTGEEIKRELARARLFEIQKIRGLNKKSTKLIV
jgi:tRNA nucleotidyltransferase (CCA-adding enzyme)